MVDDTPNQRKVWVDSHTAENILGVSRETVCRLANEGILKSARKVGVKGETSPWRFDRDELEKYNDQ